MKNTKKAVVAIAGLAFTVISSKAIVLDFANVPGTVIDFSGGAFSFTTAADGYEFAITDVQDGAGTSVGDQGGIVAHKSFTIGTITDTSTPFGTIESAPVTGTGTFYITDGGSDDLEATVEWDDITTLGTGGTLDLTGTVNLSDIVASGSDPDLDTLAAAGSGTETLSFQFSSGTSLSELVATGGETSYSGTVSAVPEPGTMTLAAAGLMSLFSLRIFRKRQ